MTNRRNKTDTIGWQAELLVWDILKRDALNLVTHNSMADADDPLIGISFHGDSIRIPEPDFSVINRGGTLFTSHIAPKDLYIEVKAKTYFGYFEASEVITTGFDNYLLEQYYQLNEEGGKTVQVYFVQIFPLAQMADRSLQKVYALSGIYAADIQALYNTRWRWQPNGMAYWPIENSVLSCLNTMDELVKATDTRDRVLLLRQIAKRDSKIWNPSFTLIEDKPSHATPSAIA